MAVAALIAIFLLLQAAFRSWRLATLAFLTLPLALVGGVVAALLAGGLYARRRSPGSSPCSGSPRGASSS